MFNLFDKQKFKSGLMSQGITMSDEEIDAYLERASSNAKPKSHLPYKQFAINQEKGQTGVSLETPYQPSPKVDENAVLDFLGNALWEAVDVGTFGAVGALDYNDYLENIITTGGPGTFAGRVGAGIGGLLGFMPPMGIAKGVAGLAVKNLSKYGTKKAGQKMVADASKIINNRSKFHKFTEVEKAKIFEPWTHTLSKYGHKLENTAVREKFIEKINKGVRTGVSEQLKSKGIRLNDNAIKNLETMIKTNMGTLEKSHMPIWNLQQRLAIMLGGGQGAGKLANIGAHVIEEAAIFAAVETPMEIMNSIDEFRDADLPGTLGHAVALGSALGLIRFIPGGKDQPIMKTAWNRIGKMMNKRRGYQTYDYSDPEARKQLSRVLVNMYNRGGKGNIFKGVLSKGDWDKLGTDAIASASQLVKLSETKEGATILSKVVGQVEKNWKQKWWPMFFRESSADLWGSTPRMIAGSMAFNSEIMFDDNVPLEDKIFNVLVGAFMTKRGRVLEYTNAQGKTEIWEPTRRPYVYSEDFKKVSEYLDILGMSPQDSLLESLIRESELTNKYFRFEDTNDVKTIMSTLEDLNVIVPEGTPKKKKAKSSANKNEHAVYDYWRMLSDIYFLPNSGKRMLDVSELTRKQVDKVEKRLKTLSLTDTKSEGGIFNVSDIDDVLLSANDKRTTQAIDLYRDVIAESYSLLGKGGEGSIDRSRKNMTVRLLSSDVQTGSPEFTEAVRQLVAAREVLEKHGYITVSKDVKSRMNIDMSPENQEKFINNMKDLDSRLHDLIYEGTPVWDDFAPKVGDEFVNNVIDHNSFYKGVRNSFEKLNGLEKDNLWDTNEATGQTDRKKINTLIEKIFSSELNLYDKVVLEDIPRDAQKLQTFLDNLLESLSYTSKYRTPPGFITTRKENPVTAADARELRNLFINNGLNGFAFTGNDSEIFMNHFKRHVLDRTLRSAVRTDGNPFTGTDRAKIESLIKTGIISPKLDIIDINHQINALTTFAEKPEFMKLMQSMKDSGGKIVLDADVIKTHFNKTSIDFISMIQSFAKEIEQMAAKEGVAIPEFVADVHGKYNEHIKPYIKDGTGKGLLNLSDIKAEADLATMRELVTRLNMMEKDAVAKSHKELMDTLDELSNAGQTKEINDFINKLRNKFWDRRSDMPELLALMTRYGPEKEPLYDAENRKFNFHTDGVESAMKKVMREIDLMLPTTMRNNFVEQRMRELLKEKVFESDSHTNVTPESFIEKYHISLGKDKESLTYILKNSSSPHEALKGRITLKRKDDPNTLVSYKDFNSDEKIEFMDDVILLTHGTLESRKVERLITGQNAGVWIDKDNTVYDNPYFRFLDDMVANYYIVDKKVETANGLIDIRSEEGGRAAEDILLSRLGKGGQALDAKMRADKTGINLESDNIKSQYFINIGDFTWGIAIPKEKADDVFTSFRKFVKDSEKIYTDNKYKKVFKRLNDIIAEKSIKDDAENVLFSSSTDLKDGQALETMLNTMWMGKMAGKVWWDHLSETVGGRSAGKVAKFTKRFRLMSNVSGRELSDDFVKRAYFMHKNESLVDTNILNALEILKDNKGLNIVIAKDEGDGAIMSDIFSTLRSVRDQINEELNQNQSLADRQDNITGDRVFSPVRSDLEIVPERGDASTVDSVMLMPLKYFKSIQLLSGSMNKGNIGGIKPIVSKIGEGILLGKTVILPDTRFDGFFAENNKVHAIMMDSANKIAGEGVKKLDLTGMTLDQFRTQSIGQDDFINKIAWRDLNIASIVAADHHASISYQAGNELGLGLSGSMYRWLIEPSVKKYENITAEMNDPYNTISGTATAKAMDDPGTSSNQTLSAYNYWIRNNGPTQFKGVDQPFKNQIKRRFIDEGLLGLRNEHGTQSVMSPFIGGSGNTLRNTTFSLSRDGTARKVYTYGQAEIAGVNRNKKVVLDRLNIIEHNNIGRDAILSHKEFENQTNFKRAVGEILGAGKQKLHDNIELHKVVDVLRRFSELTGVQHEVALVFHRPPRTRQGDMIITGLKGFVSNDIGNQARLNPFDAWARAEADYDVDKINYWWDTPNDVLTKWSDNSGKAGIISPEPEASKVSLKVGPDGTGYDHLNAASMRQLNNHYHLSSRARGPVVKAQRIVQFLREYSSKPDEKGIVLDLYGVYKLKDADVDSKRIVFDEENADKNLELLAEDIQRIVDSDTGYNSDIYNSAWFERFLFGDGDRYQGILKKEILEGRDWQPLEYAEDVPKFTAVEKDIILETIKPYQGLLQLGTNLFENGEARTPRYDDLITHTRNYNSFMRSINKRVHSKLRKKYFRENSDNIVMLDKIFGWDEQNKKITNTPLGEFGDHASLGRSSNTDARLNRNLPFEKMLAVLQSMEKKGQDGPKNMFGGDLATFESQFNDLLNLNVDTDKMMSQISTTLNNMKSDVKRYRFLKYLGWKLKNSENLYRNAMRDGHINFAESIKSSLDETRQLYNEVETSITNSPETINYVSKIAFNRIKNEIIASPRKNKYKTFGGNNPRRQAIDWVKNNTAEINKFVPKDIIKFKGIDSPEYRDVLIFSQILNKYKNVFIDSDVSMGQHSVIFEQDIREFKKRYKTTWKELFKDKKRQDKYTPWLNESRVMNLLQTDFQRMFEKWENVENGLGKLFLWKIMAPDADIGTYTYFNGKIMEGFNNASLSFIKFGFRFYANSKDISEFEKNMFFDMMSNQYTDWYHSLHSVRLNKEGMTQRNQWDMSREELYESSNPLIDYAEDYGGNTMQREWNPGMHSIFGFEDNITYGYLKDLSSIPDMKAAADHHIFPRGFIPFNHRGGDHPHITGWADFNKARRSEAYLMLGESLGKGIVMYREAPTIRRAYSDVDSKPESHGDIRAKINDKATDPKSEENGPNPC